MADRIPPPRKEGPSVGASPAPFHGTWCVWESKPERAVLTLLMALPGVRSFKEQVTVRYRRDGIARTYTIDVVVREANGRRVAFAIKDTWRALEKDDTIETLRAIHAEHGATVADEYRVVTLESLDPVALRNAERIVACGLDQDLDARERVRQALPALGATVTLDGIARATGLGRRGVRAATALIQSGILMPPIGQSLTPTTPLSNRAA